MKIGFVKTKDAGALDPLLSAVAKRLIHQRLRICGVVQINTPGCAEGRCDMDVQVLPDGPVIRISQSLGTGARGCRLDAAALEDAAGHVATHLDEGADLLIVNKFGKHEASGRGFRDIIAGAIERDIPVLVGVNDLNQSAFEAFTGGYAERLTPDVAEIDAWCLAALRQYSEPA